MHAERMDGLLAIAGCDKTLPGMMMAMIRLDLPAVFAYGGSIRPGCFRGQDVSIQDVYEAIGAQATGKMSLDDLTELECVALPGKGSCASMYTANTMASISEALGLTVPGMASPAAEDPAREAIVRAAAATLVDALENDRRPSAVLSEGLVRERDDGRRRARRLDERLPARARARRRGGDRLRPGGHRPDLASHAADRRDAPRRALHDAGPARRGRRAGRDARAPRRRPARRGCDDGHGTHDRGVARRRGSRRRAAHARAATRSASR